jgi:hypothetical protein
LKVPRRCSVVFLVGGYLREGEESRRERKKKKKPKEKKFSWCFLRMPGINFTSLWKGYIIVKF